MKKNKKNVKRIIIIFVLIAISLLVSGYVTNKKIRTFIDKKILGKQLDENTIKSIEINMDENPKFYSFSKYICVFLKNELKFYDSSTNLVKSLSVEMSNPIIKSNGKYLLMAEEDGKSVCLISDTNIVWKNDIEGNIRNINVNSNGYATIIVSNNIYKSIICVYNKDGVQLFKSYRSTSLVVGTDISRDNKYLAFGEVDYSGIKTKSKINIVSIDMAIKESKNSVKNEYEADFGKTIVNLRFDENNDIIVMYNDSIEKYTEKENKELLRINNDIIFCDIDLKNHITSFEKESSEKFSFKYKIRIKNDKKETENFYVLNSNIPKKVITEENIIAMNFGTEVKIINTSAWLLKEYKSSKQIKDIILGKSILGIIYKDRIEIISF